MESMSIINGNIMDLLRKRESWGKQIASSTSPHSNSDFNRHLSWMVSGNKQYLENLYADQIQYAAQRMYLNTDGHWWIDRVRVNSTELQRARLGGVAAWRGTFYPGHIVSWKFAAPANGEDVAILIPKASLDEFTVLAYNTRSDDVEALMTAWDITPGTWEATIGTDSNGDDIPDTDTVKRTISLERTKSINITFKSGSTTVVRMKLIHEGTPYWERPDLGIGEDDITVSGRTLEVVVHNLGSVASEPAQIALFDTNGKQQASADIPLIDAPLDLKPRTAIIRLELPQSISLKGSYIVILSGQEEITNNNNRCDLHD
jgi:hypothetical protein